jgi:phosphotransferase system IIB component
MKKESYKRSAKLIYDSIGTSDNYDTFYNCFTRMRFIIRDKKLVNEEKIKELDLVQGIN